MVLGFSDCVALTLDCANQIVKLNDSGVRVFVASDLSGSEYAGAPEVPMQIRTKMIKISANYEKDMMRKKTEIIAKIRRRKANNCTLRRYYRNIQIFRIELSSLLYKLDPVRGIFFGSSLSFFLQVMSP